MTIAAHKWKAQWNCTCIEKFHYTKDGHHCGIVDQRSPDFKPEFTWYEGRIMLDKGRDGRFFVDWSTNERIIKCATLGELRLGLADFLDGIRTKSDMSDINSWELCIYWIRGDRNSLPQQVRIKRDGNKCVIRYAAWDEKREEFVVQSIPFYNVDLYLEMYTEQRWKDALTDAAACREYYTAERSCGETLRAFKFPWHESVVRKVWVEQTTMFTKHQKMLQTRLDVLQCKENEKKAAKP